jgi:hypothetical protein
MWKMVLQHEESLYIQDTRFVVSEQTNSGSIPLVMMIMNSKTLHPLYFRFFSNFELGGVLAIFLASLC